MKSSVIICAYTLDRWADLQSAVASCDHQTLAPSEVIVVIDYNDELAQRSRESFPHVRVIDNHLTKGLSGARNSGVLAATGDVIAFLDDDAYADPAWLERLTAPLSDDDVAGAGGWIIPHWPGDTPSWYPSTFLWVLGCSYDGLPADAGRIRNPIGASMAMKREVFLAVGGFTAGLGRVGTTPLGCEETELCIRYQHEHPTQRFVLARDAVVHHRVPASRLTTRYFLSRCWAEGLSKAAVSTLVGADQGLAAERRHVMKAIPRELVSSLVEMTSDPATGAKKFFLIVAGSVAAAAGLVRGTLVLRSHPLLVEPVSLEPGGTEPRDPAGSNTAPSPWRPLAFVTVDADQESRDIVVPEGYADTVWVEVQRRGDVVGRRVVRAPGGLIDHDTVAEFLKDFEGIEPSRVDVADDELPRVTVVVPTICERPEGLTATVEHLLGQSYPHFDIVVVDNRRDRSSDFPDFSHFDKVRVVTEDVPGISAARNRGVRAATGEVVAFTDDDVVVDSRWLRALGGRLAHDPSVDAVGGLVLPAELATPAQLWFEEFFGGFSQSFEFARYSATSHPDDPLYPYAPGRFGAGCNMAFRVSTLERLGGFRPALGTGTPARGGEDLAAFFDVIGSGGIVAFEPSALVRHFHRRTAVDFENQVRGYGVGLAAFYCAEIASDPRHLLRMVRRLPAALAWYARPRAEVSATGETSFPPGLRRVQVRGMLEGPFAYLRSVRRLRQRS